MREIHDFAGIVDLIGHKEAAVFAENLMMQEFDVPFDPSNPHCFKNSLGKPLMVCETGGDLDFIVKLLLSVENTSEKLLELFADDRESVFLVDFGEYE